MWVQPDPNISPVATIPAGEAVDVVEEVANGWSRVRWGVGQEGWVDGRRLVVPSAADVGAGAPRQPSHGRWVVAVVVALAAVGAVVGFFVTQGDDDAAVVATQASQTGTGDGALTVEEVASSLEFFGDVAVVRSEPVTTTFDSSAGLFELEDGAVVDVPAGAFDMATEVTMVIVDLDFEQYVENPPRGTAYVLSTEADVALGESLVLEVPAPADTVRVMQSIDGVWRLVDVPGGPTTRIPITHFSEVPTVVVQPGIGDPVLIGGDPAGDVPGDFLLSCVFVLSSLLGDAEDDADNALTDNLALSFCARALVTKFSPSGVRVEVSCVGDKIGGDVDLLEAIDACVAETEPAETSAPPDETEEGVAESADEPEATDGPNSWDFQAIFDISDDTGEFTIIWLGSFVVDDEGAIAGSGTGNAATSGMCRVTDGSTEGTPRQYGFGARWGFPITGRKFVGDNGVDMFEFTSSATNVEIVTEPGTETGQFCVDLAEDFFEDITKGGFQFGAAGGVAAGTTKLGEEPFVVSVELVRSPGR